MNKSSVFLVCGVFLTMPIQAFAKQECRSENPIGQELMDPPTNEVKDTFLKSSLIAKSVVKCINGKSVALKSYIDPNLEADNRPVGPAYILNIDEGRRSSTLVLDFENDLDPEQSKKAYDCGHEGKDVELCSNLHTHGLHVSPSGNSDNVLLTLQPGDKFHYRYDIPEYHAPGTHWIHAHLHGSTAPQLQEGMSGALILKGKTDAWLEDQGIEDKLLILQQLKKEEPLCGDSVETSINGQCLPKISAQEGDIIRFRLIHAGITSTINFSIKPAQGEQLSLHEFARDGINLGEMKRLNNITLQPGYRSDFLFQVPKISDVCSDKSNCRLTVFDGDTVESESFLGAVELENAIASIHISKGKRTLNLPNPKDPHFKKPYKEISEEELTGHTEKVYFEVYPGEDGENKFTVNGDIFPEGSPIKLKLNEVLKWSVWVGEGAQNHPFHIHVNPFEVIVRDDEGKIIERYWKDTYLISSDNHTKDSPAELWSRNERFIGNYVLHCHNLNHEDNGMMKLVDMEYPTQSSHSH